MPWDQEALHAVGIDVSYGKFVTSIHETKAGKYSFLNVV